MRIIIEGSVAEIKEQVRELAGSFGIIRCEDLVKLAVANATSPDGYINKIGAIKEYRKFTGASLKDAKEKVEACMGNN